MTSLIVRNAPTVTASHVSLDYVIDRGEKGRETVTVRMNRTDKTSFLPSHKKDAIAACTIWDACAAYVGQEKRAAFADYRSALSVWSVRLKALLDRKGGSEQIGQHLRAKPVTPELPSDTAERIAPFIAFMGTMQAAWSGARKHTMTVFGTGKAKGQIIWTGTLSSLTRKTPTTGIIAKGRRII